ncbi:MAG: hypothetical protein JSV09_15760 [Thermoplasmata archaeon]|nr:MAG: hypothetical protein JSV09_15760 [Thermoplasmata archaeon]
MKSRIMKYLVILAFMVLITTIPFSVSAEEAEVIETGASDPQNEAPVLPIIPVEFEIEDNFIKVEGMHQETEIIEFQQGDDRVTRKHPGRSDVGNEIEIIHSTLEGSIQINVDLDVPQGCGECQVEEQ